MSVKIPITELITMATNRSTLRSAMARLRLPAAMPVYSVTLGQEHHMRRLRNVEGYEDYIAFTMAILERPGDETLRLILADWLIEHDEHQLSEFVRASVAKMEALRLQREEMDKRTRESKYRDVMSR